MNIFGRGIREEKLGHIEKHMTLLDWLIAIAALLWFIGFCGIVKDSILKP